MTSPAISLPYGKSSLEISIDPAHLSAVLRSGLHDYQPEASASQLVKDALEHPIGSCHICGIAILVIF